MLTLETFAQLTDEQKADPAHNPVIATLTGLSPGLAPQYGAPYGVVAEGTPRRAKLVKRVRNGNGSNGSNGKTKGKLVGYPVPDGGIVGVPTDYDPAKHHAPGLGAFADAVDYYRFESARYSALADKAEAKATELLSLGATPAARAAAAKQLSARDSMLTMLDSQIAACKDAGILAQLQAVRAAAEAALTAAAKASQSA